MKIPLKEWLGSIPGAVGIRLEAEPAYRISREDGAFQVRHYEPMAWAQTTVEGSRDEAMDEGFRRLADYIFGGNDAGKKMAMTTPVLQADTEKGGAWTVSFVLPEDFNAQNAPRPLRGEVRVNPIAERTLATYRFSGNPTLESFNEAESELLAWVRKQNLRAVGRVFWAQYDQPFAVPFLKRNEAMIEVAPTT